MGKIIGTQTVNVINRCRRIIIDSAFNKVPSITQEYYNVSVTEDGQVINEVRSHVNRYSLSLLENVTMTINGKEITGADIAQFFYIFNENPEDHVTVPDAEID